MIYIEPGYYLGLQFSIKNALYEVQKPMKRNYYIS